MLHNKRSIFRRYFMLVFGILIIPFLAVIMLTMKYQQEREQEKNAKWEHLQLQEQLNSLETKVEDAQTAFIIFAKSIHPVLLLRSGDPDKFNDVVNELDLANRGLSAIYLFDLEGRLIADNGERLDSALP